MNDFKVREAQRSDVRQIAELEVRCFSNPWSEASFASRFDLDPVFSVLTDGEEIIGFAIVDTLVQDQAELFNIAVSPEYRGRGLSKLLMDDVIEKAKERGATRMLLEVRVGNAAAVALYKKYGFVENGLRRGYYSAPKEDALLMELLF